MIFNFEKILAKKISQIKVIQAFELSLSDCNFQKVKVPFKLFKIVSFLTWAYMASNIFEISMLFIQKLEKLVFLILGDKKKNGLILPVCHQTEVMAQTVEMNTPRTSLQPHYLPICLILFPHPVPVLCPLQVLDPLPFPPTRQRPLSQLPMLPMPGLEPRTPQIILANFSSIRQAILWERGSILRQET